MKTGILVAGLLVVTLSAVLWCPQFGRHSADPGAASAVSESLPPQIDEHAEPASPDRVVLDISVHSVEELQVLLDRAEQLVRTASGRPDRVVLILHGPEVEYFATGNYPRYRQLVDQAKRLDAIDVVDVKICQTMMRRQGIERSDIPAFIEQVPDAAQEIDRLVKQGYVYF